MVLPNERQLISKIKLKFTNKSNAVKTAKKINNIIRFFVKKLIFWTAAVLWVLGIMK
jgi:hypothetical protein